MSRALDPKHVKSALRALEVLEFFTEDRLSASVNDVARHYDYPQSSTSELMNCLVSLGYLRRDEKGRKFLPAARMAMLGSWVQPRLFRHGEAFALMDELASATQSTVVLASIASARIQHLQVVGGTLRREEALGENCAIALLHSAEGMALLSTFCRDYLRGLIHRLNSEVDEGFRVRIDDIFASIEAMISSGYAAVPNAYGSRDIAIVLPHVSGGERLVLGLRPDRGSADEQTIVRGLRAGFGRYLGLHSVNEADAAPQLQRAS